MITEEEYGLKCVIESHGNLRAAWIQILNSESSLRNSRGLLENAEIYSNRLDANIDTIRKIHQIMAAIDIIVSQLNIIEDETANLEDEIFSDVMKHEEEEGLI